MITFIYDGLTIWVFLLNVKTGIKKKILLEIDNHKRKSDEENCSNITLYHSQPNTLQHEWDSFPVSSMWNAICIFHCILQYMLLIVTISTFKFPTITFTIHCIFTEPNIPVGRPPVSNFTKINCIFTITGKTCFNQYSLKLYGNMYEF